MEGAPHEHSQSFRFSHEDRTDTDIVAEALGLDMDEYDVLISLDDGQEFTIVPEDDLPKAS